MDLIQIEQIDISICVWYALVLPKCSTAQSFTQADARGWGDGIVSDMVLSADLGISAQSSALV